MPFLEFLEDAQRDDVNDRIRLLTKNWNDLNNFLVARIPIIELYERFHHEAEHLTNLFDNLEANLRTTNKTNDFHYIDTVWNKIQQQFTLLKNIAKLFATEKAKVCVIHAVKLGCCFDSHHVMRDKFELNAHSLVATNDFSTPCHSRFIYRF